MNEALIVILAFLWALVLLPGAIRARRTSIDATVGGFNRAMDVLRDGPDGRQVMVPQQADRIVGVGSGEQPPHQADRPARRESSVARRRRLFARMLVATGVLLLAALFLGGGAWLLFGLSVAVVAAYATMLRRWKLQRDEAREVVRDLTSRRASSRPDPREQAPRKRAVGERVGAGQGAEQPWISSGVRVRRWGDRTE